jgi:epoxyqueuosine reductase QueG
VTGTELRAAVIDAARACGADAVRIASAEPLAATRAQLNAAYDRGDLQTWPYDERYAAAASDPRTLLAEARSIVCVAVAYATPSEALPHGRGRVSNYAWSSDYHHRMKTMLAELAAALHELDEVVAEQAELEPAVGGEAHAVARVAVVVRERRDHADAARRAVEGIIPRRASVRTCFSARS